MYRKPYSTDLTEERWKILEPLLPQRVAGGRPAKWTYLEIINAILYIVRSGCAWRLLPHDLPPWQTVYWYFRKWEKEGVWERIHDTLFREIRIQAGRDPEPSVGMH